MYTHALVTKKLRAAVAGANGYAGMTAVHLLARHPGVELTQLTSRSYAVKPYSEVFPLLDREHPGPGAGRFRRPGGLRHRGRREVRGERRRAFARPRRPVQRGQ